MLLPDFDLLTPESLDEALELLDQYGPDGAKLLSGGTDLIVRMKEGLSRPGVIIVLDKVEGLDSIESADGRIAIGCRVTYEQIIKSDILNASAPVLVMAAREVGSPQIRARGTLAGNIANASPAGDTIPALYVLDVEVVLVSRLRERRIPIVNFSRGPGETVLWANEIISAVEFRPPAQPQKAFFQKIGQRKALYIAKLSVAGQLEFDDDGVVSKARIAFGAVAPTVIRAPEVEHYVCGKRLTDDVLEEAAAIACSEVRPIDDIRSTAEYRREVTGVLLKRGLASLAETPA